MELPYVQDVKICISQIAEKICSHSLDTLKIVPGKGYLWVSEKKSMDNCGV